jgi:hypothetical protein
MPQYLVDVLLRQLRPVHDRRSDGGGDSRPQQGMDAAGVTKFVCGLGKAHTLRAQPNGELLLTDGPYLEAKEHVGGLSILECAHLDDVLAWARKGTKVCAVPMPVEVRQIFFMPAPEKD